jgi:hypothetical protein
VHTCGQVFYTDDESIAAQFDHLADEWCRRNHATRGPLRVVRKPGFPSYPGDEGPTIGFKFKYVKRPPKAMVPMLDEALSWGPVRVTYIDVPGGPRPVENKSVWRVVGIGP